MPVEHLQNIIIVKLKLWLPNGSYSTFFPYTSIFAFILKKKVKVVLNMPLFWILFVCFRDRVALGITMNSVNF